MAYFSPELIEEIKTLGISCYKRKSTKDAEDKQIRSLPGQNADIHEQIIDRYDLKITSDYEEKASAFETGRKDYRKLIEEIKTGKVQVVLCWHANRLNRNYKEGGEFVQLMSDGLLSYVITPHAIYENTGRDKEYLMQEFTRATRDSDDKSDAVRRGNKEKFYEQKEWAGFAKPGYINKENPITKEKYIDIDEKQWGLLSKALQLLLTGNYTRMEVLELLNNVWGYRTRRTARQGGRPLSKSSFYRIVSDPFYYGWMVRVVDGKLVEGWGNHKKMISKEEFEKIQIILGKTVKSPTSKKEGIFKKALRCGGCGGSITFEEKLQIICDCKNKFALTKTRKACSACGTLIENMKHKKILHYIYYVCAGKTTPSCTEGSLTLKELENTVDFALKKIEISTRLRDWAIKYLNELTDVEFTDRLIISSNINSALKDVESRIDNLTKLYISPQNTTHVLLTPDELNKQKVSLLSEKEALLVEKQKLSTRQNTWLETSTRAFDFACYARYWFANGDAKTKVAILNALGSNLFIKDRKLHIDGEKAWYLIEKGKDTIQNVVTKFEPEKSIDAVTNTNVLQAASFSWLGGRDSNPDKRLQRALYYRYTTPQCLRSGMTTMLWLSFYHVPLFTALISVLL